jgi:hypothetical protein
VSDLAAYMDLLARKAVQVPPSGMKRVPALHSSMFPYQRDVTAFCLEQGRSAEFMDTGLGKTFSELEYGRCVVEHSNAPVLLLTPLAVGPQIAAEAERFGIDARVVSDQAAVGKRVNITNYERLHLFDASAFGGVILDESSVLKSFTGVTTRRLIEIFARTPFRLAATATPAPNDHMELGQHSQFLGAMNSNEMLSRWFLADQNNMGRYRLKGHAVRSFWDWVAGWARCISKPSDLGYSDEGFELPPLNIEHHTVSADRSTDTNGLLFRIPDTSATAIHAEKRLTADDRAEVIADLVNSDREAWVVWCDTDYEADALTARIPDGLEVRGSMPADMKIARLNAFSTGQARVIITKSSIAGFGLNWQHCARQAFVGLSFSYESFYQAVRRCWRFGQKRPVEIHVAMADTEREILDAVTRKADDHHTMKAEMSAAMRRAVEHRSVRHSYNPTVPLELPQWLAA